MSQSHLTRREWLTTAAAGGTLFAIPSSVRGEQSARSTDVKTFLAIDDASIPFRKNVTLTLAKPTVRAEPVLKPEPFESDAPDNLAAHFYGTVLHDGEKFRMWYYACHWGKNPDWSPRMMQQIAKNPGYVKGEEYPLFQGPLCYAESDDGIEWTKPALGQVHFKGSRENNALALPHTVVSGAIVIKDDAEPDPARRYKMTYQFFPDQSNPPIDEFGRMPTVATAVSPDGVTWTVTGIPFRNQFVEPSSFIKHDGKYIVHYQVMESSLGYAAEGGSPCGRTGVARLSPDFDHWPDLLVETFALAEPEDRSVRGMSGSYDQVHLGVGAVSLGNVAVGLYGLWHNADFADGFADISCDFGLLVSNDGLRFREPVKGHRFLRREDSLSTPVEGYDFNTILCQANGILNVGDETRIYHGRWRNVGGNTLDDVLKYYYAEVALATIPRDRWGGFGLIPNFNDGAICTTTFEIPAKGCEIVLNADVTAGLRAELVDENFQPIAAFAGENAARFDSPGGFDCRMSWPSDIASLAGKTVRLMLAFSRQESATPSVYAMYLHPTV